LVTLTGPGGTGKTRLALQVAGEVSGSYRDGVWLVELAPLGDEALVLPAIAKIFALQAEPRRSLETVLVDFLRDKKMLLLLDNCEHLIESCAALAGGLLDGATRLTILASSREPLGVPGEMILRVPSLTVPASDDATAETLKHSEAAQLLSVRGRAVRRDFQVTDENAVAVAEICRRLDGIPLAIELAASRLRLFSPQELASRLELLSAEEQALFRRLSVFVGGWTFEAAEAVGDGLDVLDLLDQLVNKSLVQTEQVAASTRFRYLETIQQYARERLFAAAEGETARDQHFAYLSGLVAGEVRNFDGPHREQTRLRLKPEMDNFRQALEWQIRRDTVAALDMVVGVVSFVVQDTGWGDQYAAVGRADVLGWLEVGAESLKAQGSDEQEGFRRSWANIHLVGGQAAMGTGKFDFVRQETAKAIALARELGDRFTLMAALGFFAQRPSKPPKNAWLWRES
jgi:predicted ATPase